MNLIEAAKRGDATALIKALGAGAAVEGTDDFGATPLLWATLGQHENCLAPLLEAGADPHFDVMAAAEDADEILEQLPSHLQSCLELNEALSPFRLAVVAGFDKVVAAFLASGLPTKGAFGEEAPLVLASKYGHEAIVQLLLESGADPREITSQGPLIAAAERGDLAIVHLLLEAGAVADENNEDDFRPLIEAAAMGHLEVVRRLVEAGADIDHVDGGQRNALGVAVEAGHQEVVDFLESRRQ